MNLDQIPLFSMLRGRLGYLSEQQKVLAQNVANADTARYVPTDLKPFSFDAHVQDRVEAALRATVAGVALANGIAAEVEYVRYYPATINSAAEAEIALAAARAVGLQADVAPHPAFTSEDFAFMLQRRPGAYLWLGQGRADPGPDGERSLHHPCYDFNDDALPLGVRWLCEVSERALNHHP